MKLSPKQKDWLKQEKSFIKRALALNPEKGFITLRVREEALDIIQELDNIEPPCSAPPPTEI